MNTVILAEAFTDSPLGATVIGVALTALITVAVAGVRIVIAVANMSTEIREIRKDVEEMKNSPDIMRYSDTREIGRMRMTGSEKRGRRT